MVKVPPYLKPGDTIGIICPAGYMPLEKAQQCIDYLQQWGFRVRAGKTLGAQYNYFSGTDEQRLEDLQEMLDDPEINAILCGRGGYGVSRIIDKVDFSRFIKHPKWIAGYSDITVLHAHLYSILHTASLHSPMAAAFNGLPIDDEYLSYIKNALTGRKASYRCKSHPYNREGSATATLAGGNLALLTHIIGSPSEIDTTGIILFIEDVGEYLYNIDRMMIQLKRSGKLDHLAALVVGKFTDMKDTVVPFGQGINELILDKVKEYDYPVCFDFPVSHDYENCALKTGLTYRLTVDNTGATLEEM